MKYQLFNGEAFPNEKTLVHSSNRSFNYGDGFFESIKISNGKAPFVKFHWQRLVAACKILQIKLPIEFNECFFRQEMERLVHLNDEPNARIRFQGFREGTGKYTPNESQLGWSMVSEPTEISEFQLNQKGLKLGICNTLAVNPAPQSSFKSSNSLPYVLGGLFAKENGFDDCLLMDVKGCIVESTTSNVILVKNNEIITSNLKWGGVAGVMRHVVLQEAASTGHKVLLKQVAKEDLLNADECWLTNATRGIQWVGAFESKRYFKRKAVQLVDQINKKFALIS